MIHTTNYLASSPQFLTPGLVRRGPALWEVLLLLASLARRADTGQRGEKALVGDELGFGVEDQSETRLVAEVDSAVVGEDLVQEQVSERGRDGLSVRRVGLKRSLALASWPSEGGKTAHDVLAEVTVGE
jgi:hypothetical protein